MTDRLVERLTVGGERLRALSPERRLAAWTAALARLVDPRSAVRRRLDPALVETTRLSHAGLQAGLEAVASGMVGPAAESVFRAGARRSTPPAAGPALVVLSSNLPGLALQTVLPALAIGRPLIVRSSRREPRFAAALLGELAAEEAAIGEGFAALEWTPGDAVEEALLARCDPVLAYGGRDALAALRVRARGRLVEYGPKLSVALVGTEAGADEIARLARDVALFDQRGCLSVQAVLGLGPREPLIASLVAGLDQQATALPPGPADPAEAAAVRRELDLAAMRGSRVIAARAGWVIDEPPGTPVRPSPGRRVVRLHRADSLDPLLALLEPLAGALQGAALAGLPGLSAAAVESRLRGLGISRLAPAGSLQETDARWHNGGIDPLEVL